MDSKRHRSLEGKSNARLLASVLLGLCHLVMLFVAYPAVMFGTGCAFWYASERYHPLWLIPLASSPMNLLGVSLLVGSTIFAAWPIGLILERRRAWRNGADSCTPKSKSESGKE